MDAINLCETLSLPLIENSEERIFSEETAYQMTSILQGAVKAQQKLKGLKVPLAGKTGTTNDNYDAWFIGYFKFSNRRLYWF